MTSLHNSIKPLEWAQHKLLDANVWVATSEHTYLRIFERFGRQGDFVCEVRKDEDQDFFRIGHSPNLISAKASCEQMLKQYLNEVK